MATDTYSVGSASRDYSTFSAAITAQGGNVNDVVLEGYNDSAFDESITIGATSPASWTIKPATGEGHDGTAGTGVRLVYSTFRNISFYGSSQSCSIEQIEQDANGNNLASLSNLGDANGGSWLRMLHHGASATANNIAVRPWGGACLNAANVVYDWQSTNFVNEGTYNQQGGTPTFAHCVLHGSGASSQRYGITVNTGATVRNCLFVNTTSLDYKFSGTATHDHNASEDATATGTGSITGISIADEVVSVVGGSEDYHLVSGSQLIGAGTDLGTTPTGINVDIDGETRSSWDIGADEYNSSYIKNHADRLLAYASALTGVDLASAVEYTTE